MMDQPIASVMPGGVTGPMLIGATGGSGTRVVARIARHGGLFIGTRLNESEDAVDFGAYSDRWVNTFIAEAENLQPTRREAMVEDLATVLHTHLSTLPPSACSWGWKEPRCIFLLPFWHSCFPDLKFLHVVRDGRDMAYSGNQNQLRKHGEALLSEAELTLPPPLRSMTLWSRINLVAADYAETHLGRNYYRVRFEDLCADPVPVVRRILEFFELEGDPRRIAQLEVEAPESVGRWHRQNDGLNTALHDAGRVALDRFGYQSRKPSRIRTALDMINRSVAGLRSAS
jgi:hypothetical protein